MTRLNQSIFLLLTCLSCAVVSTQVGFCRTSGSFQATYDELRNDTTWGGHLVGFCEGLFFPNDTIIPVTNGGCGGEIGNMTTIRRAIGTLSSRCRRAVSKYMCYLFLPKYRLPTLVTVPCTNEQANVTIAQPRTLLEWITEECGQKAIAQLAQGGFDQAFSRVDQEMESLPLLRQSCRVVDGGDLERDDDKHPEWRPEHTCPQGLVKVTEIRDNDFEFIGCQFPCPGPLHSDGEWEALKIVLTYVNPITFSMGVFSFFRQCRMPEQQRFPRILVFILSSLTMPIQIGASLGMFYKIAGKDYDQMWCENPYTPEKRLGSTCSMQGLLIQYFGKAAFCVWICVLFNLYMTIVHDVHTTEFYKNYYYVFTWIYPLIYSFIAIGMGKLHYPQGSSWCLLSIEDKGLYQYVLFYMDTFLFMLFGFYFTARILIFVVKAKMSFAASSAKTALFSVKTILFLGYMFAVLMSAGYARVEGSTMEDEITDSITEWVTCLITSYLTINETYVGGNYTVAATDYSKCSLKKTPNFGPVFVGSLLMCSGGLISLTMFAILPSDFRFFRQFGSLLREEDKTLTSETSKTKTKKGPKVFLVASPKGNPNHNPTITNIVSQTV